VTIDQFINNAEKLTNKTASTSEKTIEQTFCSYAKRRGCLPLKLITLNQRGFPDRTILCPNGKILFVEFKAAKGKLSAPQKAVRKQIMELGFRYYVCHTAAQAEKLLDEYLATS
jgi:hypothetical protein